MKTILARVYGDEGDRAVLDSALRVARRFHSHIEVLYVRVDPLVVAPILTDFGVGSEMALMSNTLESAGRERMAPARAMFEGWRGENQVRLAGSPSATEDVSVRWRVPEELDDEVTAHWGRLADLIVLGQPNPAGAFPSQESLETALFGTRRPVLLVPRTPPGSSFDEIVVAWNGSAEASAAVVLSLPLILPSRSVSVFTAAEEKHRGEAEELIVYLRRHGVRARKFAAHGGVSVADDLLSAARSVGAGLIVMGAYGHGRIREMLFGGVTRHMIDHSPIPMLMAH